MTNRIVTTVASESHEEVMSYEIILFTGVEVRSTTVCLCFQIDSANVDFEPERRYTKWEDASKSSTRCVFQL